MKRLITFVLALALFAPAIAAQTPDSFTGKWEGTLKMQRPDGTEAERPAEFNLTQKGTELTGTAGPPEQQREMQKGVVTDGKAMFEVLTPSGQLYKFTLSIVKGRLEGEMTLERDGTVQRAKIDAAKAKDAP